MDNNRNILSTHTVRYLTYNVRGLRDGKKRGAIFEWLRSQKVDLIFLQETHCEGEKEAKVWAKEWGPLSFWNQGTYRSRGVATLFNKSINASDAKCSVQENGRLQIIDFKDKNFSKPFVICNIYAPNSGDERKTFFVNLKNKLSGLQDEAFVITGGDHNCAMSTILDRRNCRATDADGDTGREEITSLINECYLEDIWRRRHPQDFEYTCKSGDKKSRIDYWLIPKTSDSKCKV